jgi:hypothetical protein
MPAEATVLLAALRRAPTMENKFQRKKKQSLNAAESGVTQGKG